MPFGVRPSTEEMKEPLLEDSFLEQGINRTEVRSKLSLRSNWQMNLIIVLQLVILVSVIFRVDLLSLNTIGNEGHAHGERRLTDGSLSYELREEWTELEEPWNLPPSNELDAAWDELLTAQNVRVTPEEMELLHENTTNRVQVLDGDYAGIMGVFHHLHCLDSIRRIIHWDYYGPRASQEAIKSGVYSKEHSDHCINGLRQAAMCHANTAFYSAEWIGNSSKVLNKELRSRAKSTCVKWGTLDSWARSRALIPGHYMYRPGPFEKYGQV